MNGATSLNFPSETNKVLLILSYLITATTSYAVKLGPLGISSKKKKRKKDAEEKRRGMNPVALRHGIKAQQRGANQEPGVTSKSASPRNWQEGGHGRVSGFNRKCRR